MSIATQNQSSSQAPSGDAHHFQMVHPPNEQFQRSGIFVENAATEKSPSPPLEERVGERRPFLAIVLGSLEAPDRFNGSLRQ